MATTEPIVVVTEPLLTPEFVQFRVLAPLFQRLARAFDVTLAAPAVGVDARRALEELGVRVLSPQVWFPPVRQGRDEIPSYILSWIRDGVANLNGRALAKCLQGVKGLRVSYAMTTALPCEIWHLQGRPLEATLRTITPSLAPTLRAAARIGGPPAFLVDDHHFARAIRGAKTIYTNSRFNALWYRERGIQIWGVIPQYYAASTFAPASAHPSRDYILAYLGKETDTATLRLLLGLGYPVKMFGAKSSGWVEGALRGTAGERVGFLGRVSEEELVKLYSNALFTAFPFTEEPFGLVPVESMACGTPVLTYRWQGPGETVLDRQTGWLTATPSEFIVKAAQIIERGFPPRMSEACLQRARLYSVDTVAGLWTSLLQARLSGAEDPPALRTWLDGGMTPTTQARATPGANRREQPAGSP